MRIKPPKDDLAEIVQELMQEFNLGKVQTEAIISSPYKFIFKKMREEKFYNFTLPMLGKIFVSPGRKDWLKKNYPRIQAERAAAQERKKKYRERRLEYQKLWEEYDKQTEADTGGLD